MTPDKFDVVIAGGGPAGSAAAFTLAARGFRVAVVDKYSFPRDKLCGGLLTLRAKKFFRQIFQADWSPVIQRSARGAKFFFQSTLLNSVTDYTDIAFTCRREFDAFLLDLAIRRGATLLENRAVKAIDHPSSSVRLADGSALRYDFLIGADGVNSAVARSLFGAPFDAKTIGFGLELEVPLIRPSGTFSPSGEERWDEGVRFKENGGVTDPELYFGMVSWGYGWVFPKRETLTAGLGGSLRRNPRLMDDFHRFLKRRFGKVPLGKIKGHHIPFGDFRPVPGRANVLLCGDAAGLVEPITGEGIAFAMQSGHFAADAVRDAAAAGQPAAALGFYQTRYETIAADFRRAGHLRHFLFPRTAQKLFAKILPRSATIPRRLMDLMADEISYAEFGRFLVRKAAAAPFCLIARPASANRNSQ